MRWGEWEESITAYTNALDVLMKLKNAGIYTAEHDKCSSSLMILSTMQNIGKSYTELGIYEKALEIYSEVIRFYRADEMLRYSENSGSQNDCVGRGIDTSTDMARVYQSMGKLYMYLGNTVKSMDLYLQALSIFRSIDSSQYIFDIASLLGNIGWLHLKKQEFEEAEAVLNEALNVYNRNGEGNPDCPIFPAIELFIECWKT
eukprot:6273821-Ditylum_brightwellii.AAC.1